MKKSALVAAVMGLFLIVCDPAVGEDIEVTAMKLTSPEFEPNGAIPARFTCQGDDVNPLLRIAGVPASARSLALIMYDPDAPSGMWVHWVLYNIYAGASFIDENTTPGLQGVNSWGKLDYGGPCPPSGTHRYIFKLYALDIELPMRAGATKQKLEEAIQGHVCAQAELIGTYKKR